MTLAEYKVQLLLDDYKIEENIHNLQLGSLKDSVKIDIFKTDVDGLVFNHFLICSFDFYVLEERMIPAYQDAIHKMSQRIYKRRVANIQECNHVFEAVGTLKKCTKCLGNFGQIFVIETKFN